MLFPLCFSLFAFRFQFSADDGSRVPLLAAVYLSAPLSLADLLAAITFVVKRSKVGCSTHSRSGFTQVGGVVFRGRIAVLLSHVYIYIYICIPVYVI